MSKLKEAQEILKALGLPSPQQNEMSALTLLALCNIKKNGKWKSASRSSLGVTKGIMTFVTHHKKVAYAPNTRETFRRQVLHQFVQAGIADYNPDQPDLPVNSPRAHYSISVAALDVIKYYGTRNWEKAVTKFLSEAGSLTIKYAKERKLSQIPVKLSDGTILKLSPGKHNEVQAAIVEQFAGESGDSEQYFRQGSGNLFRSKVSSSFRSKVSSDLEMN
jgi:type II restriction enzyme